MTKKNDEPMDCCNCGGSGVISNWGSGWKKLYYTCPRCHGTGKEEQEAHDDR